MPNPQLPTRTPLEPGDVIYAPGWNFCYQAKSGPFCRIHYIRWQGRLACTPSDSLIYVSYFIQALGGKTISRIIIRASHFSYQPR